MNDRLLDAHRYSMNHREKLLKDTVCGCFYCLKVFSPKEITDWVEDAAGTAICPYCGIDSVIGGHSGYPTPRLF